MIARLRAPHSIPVTWLLGPLLAALLVTPTPGSAAPAALRWTTDANRAPDPIRLEGAPEFRTLAAGDRTGAAVSAAGDVNGDGFSDYLVASPDASSGQGRVDVFVGSASGPTLQRTLTSTETGSSFGFAVAALGDVNGDGFDDIAIGQPLHDDPIGPTADVGRVMVYRGSASGIGAVADHTIGGKFVGDQLGYSVAGAGDVDHDGFDDMLLGVPFTRLGAAAPAPQGGFRLYRGSATGLSVGSTSYAATMADQMLGFALSGVGDLDADGFDDVIVGAPYPTASPQVGRVFIYRGSPGGLTSPPDSILASSAGARFGFALAAAGDFNGDGYADAAVGAPDVSSGAGRVFLLLGSATGATLPGTSLLLGAQAGARVGYSVGCAGDRNGDGLGDVVIGEPFFDGTLGVDEGRVQVAFGTRATFSSTSNLILASNAVGAQYGFAVSGVGDLAGDGFAELAIGEPGFSPGGAARLSAGAVAIAARNYAVVYGTTAFPGGSADQVGAAVGSGGDFNGDGFDDALGGCPHGSYLTLNEGTVYVLDGFLNSGSGAAVNRILHIGIAGSLFGQSVAVAGDINGDGYDDAIVGAPGFANGEFGEGAAFFFRGTPAGLDTLIAPWTIEGNTVLKAWGSNVSAAGDLNGDGFADVAIGSAYDGTNGANAGRVAFYLGSPAGPSPTPAFELFGQAAHDSLGAAIASVSDINADGYSDVAVGAPGHDFERGRVVIVYGSPVFPLTTQIVESNSATADFFGEAIAGGDVNADGFADVAIGAPRNNLSAGLVEIHRGSGSGLDVVAAQTLAGPAGSLFGNGVGLGDLSGDGRSDLVVGAPFLFDGAAGKGGLFCYLSTTTGTISPTSLLLTRSSALFQGRGTCVATTSDFNGDGFNDILSGAPRSLFSGTDTGVLETAAGAGNNLPRESLERMRRADDTGPLALLDRSDSETSFRLALLARSAAGRRDLSVEWQAGPTSTPFSALPSFVSAPFNPGAPDPTEGVRAPFSALVSGLPTGGGQHWRMRVRTRSPWFPRSVWLTPSGNAATMTDVRTLALVAAGEETGARVLVELAGARPNPSLGPVTLAYRLGAPGQVELTIHDLAGRLVCTLARGLRMAGTNAEVWDGRDAHRARVGPGVYFARLAANGKVASRTIVRLD